MAPFALSSAKNCRSPKPPAPTKKSWSQAPPEKSSSFLRRGDEIFTRIVSLPPVCDGQQSAEFSARFLGSGSVSDYRCLPGTCWLNQQTSYIGNLRFMVP